MSDYKVRVRDRKPRGRARGLPRMPAGLPDPPRRANKTVALLERTPKGRTSEVVWDRTPGGRKSGLVFMRYPGGAMTSSPAMSIAWWLRAKLAGTQRRRADVTVYDAAGTPVAIIDGETRERRPLSEVEPGRRDGAQRDTARPTSRIPDR